MVFGRNKTDAGADSNGSGKSGLLEGMTLATTGKTCRDVGRDEFINDNADECYVEFVLENEIAPIKELIIKRWIHRKKSARIELWEDGELNKEMTSVNEANARIFELLGITREDLLHFFIIGQNTNYAFLSAGDSDQKEIIARLTNADIINEKIEKLKEKKKEADVITDSLEKSVRKYDNFIELTKNELIEEKKTGNKELKNRIEKLKEEVIEQEVLVEENENKAKKKEKEIEENEKLIKLNKKQIVDTSEIERKIDIQKGKIRQKRKSIGEAEDLVSDMERILNGKTVCPSCSHEWNEGEDVDLATIPDLIKETEDLIKDDKEWLEKYKKRLEATKKKLDVNDEIEERIGDLETTNDDLIHEAKRLRRKKTTAQDTVKELKTKQLRLEKDLKSSSKIDGIKAKLNEYENKREIEQEKYSKSNSESDDLNYWIHHFSKKGFLTYLTNQSIKTIEGVTNSYLKKFNTDLKVNIDGYTVLKNNDIREKINISIVRNGRNVGSFERYSGGEKGRINIACIVGLQKLMNMSANNGGLNFLGLDEVFEGLDTTSQKDVLKILETIGVTTMVVSHRSDAIGAENEICIDKVDGISKIVKIDEETE